MLRGYCPAKPQSLKICSHILVFKIYNMLSGAQRISLTSKSSKLERQVLAAPTIDYVYCSDLMTCNGRLFPYLLVAWCSGQRYILTYVS